MRTQRNSLLGNLKHYALIGLAGLGIYGCAPNDYIPTLNYSPQFNTGYAANNGSNACLNYRNKTLSAAVIAGEQGVIGEVRNKRDFEEELLYDTFIAKGLSREEAGVSSSRGKFEANIPLVEIDNKFAFIGGISASGSSSSSISYNNGDVISVDSSLEGIGLNLSFAKSVSATREFKLDVRHASKEGNIEMRINEAKTYFETKTEQLSLAGEFGLSKDVFLGVDVYQSKGDDKTTTVSGWGSFRMNPNSAITVYGSDLDEGEIVAILSSGDGNPDIGLRGVMDYIKSQLPMNRWHETAEDLLNDFNFASDLSRLELPGNKGKRVDLILRKGSKGGLEAKILGTYILQKDKRYIKLSGGAGFGDTESLLISIGVEQ